MIDPAVIKKWYQHAPWVSANMVEHDYLLIKVLHGVFTSDDLHDRLALSGAAALHKLYLAPLSLRFTEHLEVTQIPAERIKPTCDALRKTLFWLDTRPRYDVDSSAFTFYFRYFPTHAPHARRELRISINTREHISHQDWTSLRPQLRHPECPDFLHVVTYRREELGARIFRKIFARGRGRDVFDYWCCMHKLDPACDRHAVHRIIRDLMPGVPVADLIARVYEMRHDARFRSDIENLIRDDTEYLVDESLDFLESEVAACFG